MVTYVNDPTSPNYCPDPSLVSAAAIEQALTIIKSRFCEDINYVKQLGEAQVKTLEEKIAQLEGEPGLAEKLEKLSDLVDALNLDGDDSIVDDLLNIKQIAEDALEVATKAADDSTEAKQLASKVAGDLANFQTAISLQFSNFTSTVGSVKATAEEAKATAADNTASIAELAEAIGNIPDNLEGVGETYVNDTVCANNQKIVTAFESLATFATDLFSESCIAKEA